MSDEYEDIDRLLADAWVDMPSRELDPQKEIRDSIERIEQDLRERGM